MKAFISAICAAVVIGVIAAAVLTSIDMSSAAVFATSSVRL
ncbi:MAG TPA: hypothetical protein VKY65_14155 [Alphaproteobacteria bacterium]|nr:hypothetical protein [Alphaproteobacteria bacterium]